MKYAVIIEIGERMVIPHSVRINALVNARDIMSTYSDEEAYGHIKVVELEKPYQELIGKTDSMQERVLTCQRNIKSVLWVTEMDLLTNSINRMTRKFKDCVSELVDEYLKLLDDERYTVSADEIKGIINTFAYGDGTVCYDSDCGLIPLLEHASTISKTWVPAITGLQELRIKLLSLTLVTVGVGYQDCELRELIPKVIEHISRFC